MRRRLLGILFTAVIVAGTAAAEPRDAPRGERRYSAGTYVTTALSNIVYLPAKVLLAGTGAVSSGIAYVVSLGNENVARSIWDPSVRGDYVVTPEMIEGGRRVRFVGSPTGQY